MCAQVPYMNRSMLLKLSINLKFIINIRESEVASEFTTKL